MVVSDFNEQVKVANEDEQFVTKLMNMNDIINNYTWVGKNETLYNYGDIKITGDNYVYYADVKSDSVCHRTGNILAEYRVKWRGKGWFMGFMQKSKYDYIFYLSKAAKKIYIIDFKVWQKYYTKYYKSKIFIPHNDKNGIWLQTTEGYLLQISKAIKLGIIVAELEYTEELNITNIKEYSEKGIPFLV